MDHATISKVNIGRMKAAYAGGKSESSEKGSEKRKDENSKTSSPKKQKTMNDYLKKK